MLYVRMICGALLCAVYFIFNCLLDLVGLFVIAAALLCRAYAIRSTLIYPDLKMLQFTWSWMWLWCNEEDGIDGLNGGMPKQQWWALLTANDSVPWRIFKWSVIRNRTDNLRFIKSLNPPQRADAIKWMTLGNLTFIWQGIFCRFIYEDMAIRRQAGWKYEPARDEGGNIISYEAAKIQQKIQSSTGWQTFGIGFGADKENK